MTRLIATGLVSLLLAVVFLDDYGWLYWVTDHTGVTAYWKVAITSVDVLLLTVVGVCSMLGRWTTAHRFAVAELAYAATVGLFVARSELIWYAVHIDWHPGNRLLLGIYIGTLLIRLLLVLLLARTERLRGSRGQHPESRSA